MPKLIALEWDAREARIAVAQSRGKEISLDDAFAIRLTSVGEESLSPEAAGERIAAALAARNVGKGEVLVAVGRASIELRQMSLPPAPAEELPEMVRFQALRQFTTISADWPLDFVPLEVAEGENPSVLAAAISPDLVDQIRTTCQASDLTPRRLILRPFAAASLLRRHDRRGEQPPRLMVDILRDEADLTVLDGEHVVLMRTVRLPAPSSAAEGDDVGSAQSRALAGQIRRTVAAAQNQMRGKRIEKVVVCGDGSDQSALKAHLEQELNYNVEMFDPFAEVRQSRNLRRPEHAGRFAPLIGMLRDEADGSAHALDFLHPRKKPEPPNRRRQHILWGAAAAALAIAATLLIWLTLSDQDAQIAALTAKLNSQRAAVKQAEGLTADMARLEEFRSYDFVWLDEIYDLCEALPPSSDVLLAQFSVSTDPGRGGRIDVSGFTSESRQIDDVDRALRTGGRQVVSALSNEDMRRTDYPWRFKKTAILEPRKPADEQSAAADSAETDPAKETSPE